MATTEKKHIINSDEIELMKLEAATYALDAMLDMIAITDELMKRYPEFYFGEEELDD